MPKVLLIAALLSTSLAFAQPTALLEACNNIPDSSKRLECFGELFRHQTQSASTSPASKLKETIVSFDSAIASQLSLSQYRALRLELAKGLGVYKASPNAELKVVELVSEALNSYTDAETFWSININEGGSQGLLSPEDMTSYGMGGFIEKYNIPLVDLNWNKWVSRRNGLSSIWSHAKSKSNLALPSL